MNSFTLPSGDVNLSIGLIPWLLLRVDIGSLISAHLSALYRFSHTQ